MQTDNIQYYVYEEDDNNHIQEDFSFLLNELEDDKQSNGIDDLTLSEISNYEMNFTNKQLQLILEYYGLSKGLRTMKKHDLISHIMVFETDPKNSEITTKRKLLWYYMEELKKDKIMKRFILHP